MTRDPKGSRRGPDNGISKATSRAGGSRVGSPCSVRSAVSASHPNRDALRPKRKTYKESGHSVKQVQRKDREATHRKCFVMMDKLEEDLQLAFAEKYDERAHNSQLLEKLRAEKARETSKLQEAITVRETAVAENERLQRELCQLQQQVESTNATMQDQVSWNDVQLVLHQTHGELVSATTRFWNTIEAFQNRRLASYLPGSGVIHGDWTEQGGPLGTLSHSDLPGFSASGNLSLVTQQEPAPANVYSSLV
ncbi:uncharacterized protein N7498_001732 [Penicillium cinerascens]|uniref:Uncharacterized protein n=1 Tax=Penicillium cinerascens TaxID=70096 RepID=A0A9W9N8Q4_9EURO|nr:uncharacterized protein N7498_001732 [Penicillium cinerascens]KAJ5215325.1 hypothetical protein N7498_001732 [Penicillium cinerascens]